MSKLREAAQFLLTAVEDEGVRGVGMSKLREAAQAMIKAWEDGEHIHKHFFRDLRDALAEEPIIGEQEFKFREPGVKIWEQQMALTPFGEQELKADGWRRCAEGQGETQFCALLEAAVAAEREACAQVAETSLMRHEIAAAIRARGQDE